jgi:putative ABC transport system substrate-binding protein
VRRRLLVGGLAAWPVLARAQAPAPKIVGFLHSSSPTYMARYTAAVLKGLAEQGFSEGRTLRLEVRSADAHDDRLPGLARELIDLKADALLAAGGTAPALAVKALTTTLPTVFVSAADPLKAGIVASLGRPGGNFTGISLIGSALEPKRLEILSQLVPGATLAALVSPQYPDYALQVDSLTKAAAAIGRPLELVKVDEVAGLEPAIAALRGRGIGGLLVTQSPLFGGQVQRIVDAASGQKLPAVYWNREFIEAGGLLSYGTNFFEAYREAGTYLGRILKGASPADLPVVQPTKFELALNLKAARAIGLEFPGNLMANADEQIE